MSAIAENPDTHSAKAEELLSLAVSRPRQALVQARALLAETAQPGAASMAHQAAGIVLRDLGDLAAAIREFRTALRLAGRTGERGREADVLASLGVALAMNGRTEDSLAAFAGAVERSDGALAARVLTRRGGILSLLGRHGEALRDLTSAAQVLRGVDEPWEARALLARAQSLLALGKVEAADSDAGRAELLFRRAGQELESAMAVHNRGLVAFHAGRIPESLAYLAEAEQRYEFLDFPAPELAQERCDVLLAAGLAQEALLEVESALDRERAASKRADLYFAAAAAALASGQSRSALDHAVRARRLFRSQDRGWWMTRSEFVAVSARYLSGQRGDRLLKSAIAVAGRLDELHGEEAALAHLLAGRLAAESGRRDAAEHHLGISARARRRGPALARATGWLAQSLRHGIAGRPLGVTRAAASGLAALDEHRLTLGGAELRALSTGHGRELATLMLREALVRGDSRALLRCSERWRATALAVPQVRPPEDEALASDLAALRDAGSRLEQARAEGSPYQHLERERDRWEVAVRRRLRHVSGTGGSVERFDLPTLLAELENTQLIELVEIDATLFALVAYRGRVHKHLVGPIQRAVDEVEFARFALRRIARGHRVVLREIGLRLQEALIGTALSHPPCAPVLIVPPGRLHAVPWALLPGLAHRPLAVSPSAALWQRARRSIAPPDRGAALVVGPGLGTAGAEVPVLAELYRDATLVRGRSATVGRVLEALDGTWLAHVAAHGNFRADSPLFSALEFNDGPLTVYDLERVGRAPYRIVLSACDSGLAAAVGSDELLGLLSGLLPLGTAGVLASIVPVNDEATVALMIAAHRSLHRGRDLPHALLDARQEVGDEPLLAATGASFLAFGV